MNDTAQITKIQLIISHACTMIAFVIISYLVELLCSGLRRLPGGELHEREVFPGHYPDRAEFAKAVESVPEILIVSER